MNEDEIKKIIDNSYLKILKRKADIDGLNYFTDLMNKGELNQEKLENILINSDEFVGYKQKKNLPVKKLQSENLTQVPKIIAIYRIRNEERWIKKSLESISEICQEIIILDDCSTDKTVEICKKFPSVVEIYERKDELPLNEVRDKKIIWEMAMKRNPDFILKLDGDEVLAPNSKDIIFNEIMNLYPNDLNFSLQLMYIYDKPNQWRTDAWFDNIYHIRLIRINEYTKDLKFEESGYPGNAHSLHLPPTKYVPVRSDVKILHYSLYDKKIRKRKFNYFHGVDPGGSDFNGYKDLISGDVDESVLELKILPEGKFWKEIK
ncbi:glycosyltransferase family 2 protein [Nitrosopumilus sp.]|nr:glycosyltransferase family 2 protein [Nitrosopumilus sp.]